MIKLRSLFVKAAILTSILTSPSLAKAETVTVPKDRSLTILGPIGSSAIYSANELLEFKGNDPVWLVLNSPGGSIIAGMQILSAMRILKERGTPIHCVVPMMAASMAFQILAECDKRYGLHYSLLLWHPPRIQFMGVLTPKLAKQIAIDLRMYEKEMVGVLLEKLQIDPEVFFYHYHAESLFFGGALNELVPGFITIVDDIKGVDKPFSMR